MATDNDTIDRLAKRRLLLAHPPTCPAELPAPLTCLLSPPGLFSATADWISWRTKMFGLSLQRPDDPNFPVFFAAAETVIAWRETIPAELRFWPEE